MVDASVGENQQFTYWVRAQLPDGVGSFGPTDRGSVTGWNVLPTASNGTRPEAVVVTWPAQDLATDYTVWRAAAADFALAEMVAERTAEGPFEFVDTEIVVGIEYFYWVQPRQDSFAASVSEPDAGFALPKSEPLPQPAERDAVGGYNSATGEIVISANGVVNAFVESATNQLTPGSTDQAPAGLLASDNASRVGLTGFGGIEVTDWTSRNTPGMLLSDLIVVVGPALGVPSITKLVIPLGSRSEGVIPQNVKIESNVADTGWLVTWDAIPNANYYLVIRSSSHNGADGIIIGETTEPVYLDENVDIGETYYYSVRTVTDDGNSVPSAVVRTVGTIEEMGATDGTLLGRIGVSWSEVPGAASYEVWRSSDHDLSSAILLAEGITETRIHRCVGGRRSALHLLGSCPAIGSLGTVWASGCRS